MISISSLIFYILVFSSVYIQVFFLITLLENRKKIVIRNNKIKLAKYPGVTIIVPCWNEEGTIYKTVRSLLDLNYPKNKLKIFLVDDGSTDGTYKVLSSFAKYSNVTVFQKENGGKHTALNLGLEHTDTEFVGCLDADSFAHPEALVRIMSTFEKDPEAMAVAPSVTVYNPKNILQNAQKAEYHMGVYLKKMLGLLGAINVTPGPLTIFRKKVFNDLGPYRHAHNTEDMEIAYRMQKNFYKIEHCNDAYVYTNIPKAVGKLYKQRLRWIYGFINNTIDYKEVILNKKYGNFSLFTLPTGILSILSVVYLFWKIIYSAVNFLYTKFVAVQTVGFESSFNASSFDPFFISLPTSIFMVLLVNALVIFSMVVGRRMAEGKWKISFGMLYFFPVFAIIAPFWILRALLQTAMGRGVPSWR
jgi:cellulose synthase/poly-beta-1,6-N-acetylglucosamine synthase-like glycosyltransferase